MKLISGFILKAAVEPRIDTDGHGYQELDNIDRFTRKVTSVDSHLSVLIRVNPCLSVVNLPGIFCYC